MKKLEKIGLKSRVYADFPIRLGAGLIDYVLTLVFGFLFGMVSVFATGGAEILEYLEHPVYSLLIGVGLIGFYHLFFLTIFSTTPGQALFGLKVYKLKSGERIGFFTALVRIIFYAPSSIFMLGFLWIIFDSKNMAWHDHIARTFVHRNKKKAIGLAVVLAVISGVITLLMLAPQFIS